MGSRERRVWEGLIRVSGIAVRKILFLIRHYGTSKYKTNKKRETEEHIL